MNRNLQTILAAWAICGLAGCDLGGTYSKRYNESLVSVGKRAEEAAMLHGTTTAVPDAAGGQTGVQLKLPSVLDNSSKPLPNTDVRSQPPFVKLPGLNFAYERMLDDPADPSKFAPAYCYLGAVSKAEQPADVVQAEVLKTVQAAFPGSAWTQVQAGGVSAKLLSVSGPQDFDNGQIGGPVAKLEGQMDLYLYETGTHVVLIGFRAPSAQAGKYKFFDAARMAIGTITGG